MECVMETAVTRSAHNSDNSFESAFRSFRSRIEYRRKRARRLFSVEPTMINNARVRHTVDAVLCRKSRVIMISSCVCETKKKKKKKWNQPRRRDNNNCTPIGISVCSGKRNREKKNTEKSLFTGG
jgi:hypothetical protein